MSTIFSCRQLSLRILLYSLIIIYHLIGKQLEPIKTESDFSLSIIAISAEQLNVTKMCIQYSIYYSFNASHLNGLS